MNNLFIVKIHYEFFFAFYVAKIEQLANIEWFSENPSQYAENPINY